MPYKNCIYYIFFVIILCILFLLYKSKQLREYFEDETIVVHDLTGGGFFSLFFFLCSSYIYAKKYNYKLYIDNGEWDYKYKNGWNDYFTSLIMYDNLLQNKKIIKRGHATKYGYNDEKDFTLKEYVEAIRYIFKPNIDIEQKAKEYIDNLGKNYSSIYIRRGDKITSGESHFISTKDILNFTDIQDNCKVLFVQTDDYSVVEEIKEILPNCAVHTMTPINKKGSTNSDIHNASREDVKKDTDELLISTIISANANKCWADYRSNVGRFLKLYSFDKKNVFYYPPNPDKENLSNACAFKIVGN